MRPAAPRATDLVVQAVRLALSHYRALIAAITVPLVPALAVVGVELVRWRLGGSSRAASGSSLLTELVIVAVGTLCPLLAQAAGVHAAAAAAVGTRPSWRASLRAAVARWPSVLGAGLVSAVLAALGIFFFVIPGIVIFLTLFVALPAVVMEGAGTSMALRRSAMLMRGRRGTVFLALLLVAIIAIVVSVPIEYGVDVVFSVSGGAQAAAQQVVGSVVDLLVMPVQIALATLVYLEGRQRVDGASPLEVAVGAGIEVAGYREPAHWAPPGHPVADGWAAEPEEKAISSSVPDAPDGRSGRGGRLTTEVDHLGEVPGSPPAPADGAAFRWPVASPKPPPPESRAQRPAGTTYDTTGSGAERSAGPGSGEGSDAE